MRGWILAMALPALAPAEAGARTAWMSGTFVYADLCTEPRTGELAGHRITLRRSPNGNGIVYEVAPRGLDAPARTMDVSVDDSARTLVFTAQTVTGPIAFQGVATQDGLTGTLRDPDGEHAVSLPRVLRSHARDACTADTTGSLSAAR